MRDDEPELLPDALQRLLAAERRAEIDDCELKARVLDSVLDAVALPGSGSSGSAAPAAGGGGAASTLPGMTTAGGGAASTLGMTTAKALVAVAVSAFVAGGAVGSAITARMLEPRAMVASAPTVDVSAIPPAQVEALRAAPPAETATQEKLAPSPAPAAASATASSDHDLPRNAAPPRSTLTEERELLDVARAAIGRGEAETALSALGRHASKFPNGKLAEERQALLVQALAASGRRADAKIELERLRKRFPESMQLPAAESAAEGEDAN